MSVPLRSNVWVQRGVCPPHADEHLRGEAAICQTRCEWREGRYLLVVMIKELRRVVDKESSARHLGGRVAPKSLGLGGEDDSQIFVRWLPAFWMSRCALVGGWARPNTHRPCIDSWSFQISLPVDIIIRNNGTLDGLSVTMYHVPLYRYIESKTVQPDELAVSFWQNPRLNTDLEHGLKFPSSLPPLHPI